MKNKPVKRSKKELKKIPTLKAENIKLKSENTKLQNKCLSYERIILKLEKKISSLEKTILKTTTGQPGRKTIPQAISPGVEQKIQKFAEGLKITGHDEP